MTATFTPSPAHPAPVVQHSHHLPVPVHHYAPPAPVVISAPRRGSDASLGLLVVLVAILAAAGAFYAARENAPNADEVTRYQALAADQAFRNAQTQGIAEGRSFALASQQRVAQLRAAIARQKAWNRGFRRGQAAGLNSYRQPRESYGYGGYRGRSYYAPSRNQMAVGSALASAQSIANATGAPVDVEIY